MFPSLRIGPFLLQLPGLALLAGLWFGIILTEKESLRLNLDATRVINSVFYGLIAGIVAARLAYVVQYPKVYLANPLSALSLNTNTLSPNIGLLAGLSVLYLYGYRKRLPFRPTLDALATGLALFMITLGVAHILSGNAYGAPTRLPWAIYLWSDYRHPSQIYETVAALGILLVTLRRPLGSPGAGLNFLLVVALSAAARIFLEAFRGDSLIWTGGFRAAQVIGLAILATTVVLIKKWGEAEEVITS